MDPRDFDPALLRALFQSRISRRRMLRYTGVGAGAAMLAACGVSGTSGNTPTPAGSATASPSPSPLPAQAGEVLVANWPLYIDLDKGKSESLDEFKSETGINITYKEDIGDNDEFFSTDIAPTLSADQPTGWDVVVMTDWMIAKLIQLGWIQELHHDALPNTTANLDPKFKDPWFDPGNAHSFPWAAGITGIGYNKKLAQDLLGRPVTKIADLWDPALKGRVGMFSEMRDSVNFGLYLNGVKPPENATMEDVEAAIQRLEEQKNEGIVRAYYGNDYTDPLATGDLVASMAWSGDVNFLALDAPDLEFVVPEEGGNRWSDNMCIPILAEHPTDAHEWINFVYDVENATRITEWVWYESPVAGVQELIRDHAKDDESLLAVSESTLVWPDEALLANTYTYKRLDEEEEQAWHDLFDPLLQG
jgi:spermidine/putrescine-binding protein